MATTRLWIVSEGEAMVATADALPPRETYGTDWIAVQADSAEDAVSQAQAYDQRRHPAQTEMMMFVAGYRSGAMSLSVESTAERIAARYHGDGQCWEEGGVRIEDACAEAGGRREWRDGSRVGDVFRFVFPDGSAILIMSGGWDLGYVGCYCARSTGHVAECVEVATYTAEYCDGCGANTFNYSEPRSVRARLAVRHLCDDCAKAEEE